MDDLLIKSNVNVLESYDIVDWREENEFVTKVFVESDMLKKELSCSLFLCFERKIVNRRTILGMFSGYNLV